MSDTLMDLQSILNEVRQYRNLVRTIDSVRRVTESTDRTLDRVMRNHIGLTQIMRDLEVPNPNAFDYDYSETDMISVLRDRLDLSPRKR